MNTLLPPHIYEQIDHAIQKYPAGQQRAAVKAALMLAQDFNHGWLTTELMDEIAAYLKLSPIAVYEVASFYSLFELKPVGRYKISFCTNVSCYLRGCEEIADHLKKKLNIQFGETTSDKKFTLKEVECLAACTQAPALQINSQYYGPVTIESLDQILEDLE